tara:strand:- start:1324 stop:1767 length:444 start_codon:yes stop_codon:yes gene_type:complete
MNIENKSIVDGGTINMDQLTLKIFSEEIKPPKSIFLSFDNITLKEVFEALLMFTVNGMKLKYSLDNNTVDIENLTEENISQITAYVQSIGFNLVINTYSLEEFNENIFPWFIEFNNLPYDINETDLTKYQYVIRKSKYYLIYFSMIN